MYNPVSTYRIQFHKGFKFIDFERLIPYFEKLKIGAIYASPIFKSVPGSTHGYDGTDPLTINPEIGTLSQLRRISKKLHAKNIGWIQDIVPNHMAYHPENAWLMDLLENGPKSRFRNYFDTGLSDSQLFGTDPLQVPFLGTDLETAIANDELTIVRSGHKLVFNYAGSKWPLRKGSYPKTRHIDDLNADKSALKAIATNQYYQLCSWKDTDTRINYRRFFTVNGLICLNMHFEEVFNHYHKFIGELLNEGIFQGLRVDHIDGLYDPADYLGRLRVLAGEEAYIIVEKILESNEKMQAWPIQGNTGYDFLGKVNNLMTNRAKKKQFDDFYSQVADNIKPVKQQILEKKALILSGQMGGELNNLVQYLKSGHNIVETTKKAIAEFLVRFPVYRFYGNAMPLNADDGSIIGKILNEIISDRPSLAKAINFLKDQLLSANKEALSFYQRCMQFTGPLMAKGVEDTLMYTYNRFVGHNEVGDSPEAFGISVKEFHAEMEWRQLNWPLSINGTATHDTKRGEDARARLNVLTDMGDRWLQKVSEWRKLNSGLIENNMPDANDEYFIYQTLAASYPMPGQPDEDFPNRLEEYLVKMLREAKLHSGWAAPNEAYEHAVKTFASALLKHGSRFLQSFEAFHEEVCSYGIYNSLSQVLLKIAGPGVPDIYQGCELWDLSMVDPDNRRPVDYKQRAEFLNKNNTIEHLWRNKFNGQIKQYLTAQLLTERHKYPQLFLKGAYIGLKTTGAYRKHIIAYARQYQQTCYVVIVPIGLASINFDDNFDWQDTEICFPENLTGSYTEVLTGIRGKISPKFKISILHKGLPLALLKIELPVNNRRSGLLIHITSLPGDYSIGDFGTQARHFADQLHAAGQRYWQILPLSPVDSSGSYSPYSSSSAMAGNTLLVSPDSLVDEGLLTEDDVKPYRTVPADRIDFGKARATKTDLLTIAYKRFKKGKFVYLKAAFDQFTVREAAWLNDFSLYTVLKKKHKNKPWHQWPLKYRMRQIKAMADFDLKESDKIKKVQWMQFIFHYQWHELKTYCNAMEIQIFGDLPFYISYDSVDVWVNQDIFSLDKKGRMQAVAGVPPDYFNDNGQLWGMPVFRWDVLKAQNYSWWLNRVRKNLELFDLVRLDHFRAFSAYWSVPAAEKTAINGNWEPGPGIDFFSFLKKELGSLPFVAEDLGEIDNKVYKLRDVFGLPGMKVLQFAFGAGMPISPHIPHNFTENHFVYTGTHDNNTTLGWYKQETDKITRKNISSYIAKKTRARDISKVFIRLGLSSAANVAIVPVQDLLFLGAEARMNTPAATSGNWQWRLTPKQFSDFPIKQLRKWTMRYNRL